MRHTSRSSVLSSMAAHAIVLGALIAGSAHAPRLAPTRLPGTEHGLQLLTYYSPGGAPAQATSALQKHRIQTTERSLAPSHTAPTIAAATTISAPSAQPGTGTAGPSGLGQGNINIALQKFFPPPHPDLSTLPAGTAGDVIIDATIDAYGNITELKLVHGLSDPINNAVLATVRNWTYTPATRDGTPIASEQELLFHFSRA